MKMVTLMLSALVIGGAHANEKNGKVPTQIKCCVMPDMRVDIAKATKTHMYADYNGRRYFFCCGACSSAFGHSPEKFEKATSIPSPAKS